ncbi:amidase, Asp-tRNAAsn/Glu-tRNAGln amidotransferase A subunit [Bradyrhizobium sp. YR681]|uniref:amidase n=1 Tax=Bradyrhizobium sp. YR681 TaxID=1144344 RepID=UPI00027105D8|nr:amidase [Bradyrhizobium sp. YR681]EJN11272.1 amidase, Asp-tRNAAsn/Glu-tRNAGln amidotransferase A subunit [Bradyrhizobium sp. YR681]
MSDRDLLFMPATTAASLIRKRALSPVEYVDAVLGAIERTQPTLNAYATVTADAARAQARIAEQAVMAGEQLGPFHGVPVNIKDLFATKGVRTAHGSAILADNIPSQDDILVTRLKNAGAIMVGKSTTPEFGHKGHTDGPSFGITRNPWNPARTAGGSSGGAAAAVAAGLGPLGLGTDGAGSIRIPAGACGVVGLKPTTGAVPYEQTSDSFFNYAAAGPLTRTVADAALMMDSLVGPSTLDPWSLGGPGNGALMPSLISEDLSGLRIGYLSAMSDCSADVATNTKASLAALAALGAEVEEAGAGMDWIAASARLMYLANLNVYFGHHLEKWRDRMDPVLVEWIAAGSKATLVDFRKAQVARSRLYRAVQKLLEDYDFLVTPTLPTTAIPAEAGKTVDALFNRGWNAFVYPFNQSGNPALSVPNGFGADGLPTGLQIVGRWWKDNDVLRLGAILERVRPWADRRPPV